MNLLEKAQQIKNETEVGFNTAQRIGGLFEDFANGSLTEDRISMNLNLPEAVGGEIKVSGSYLLTGVQNIGTNVIVLEGKTEFIGLNSSEDYILYTGTGSAVTGTGFSFTSMFFSYVTPNGSAFNLTGGANTFFSAVYNGVFNQANPSKITGFEDFASFKLGRVKDGAGFEFDGTMTKCAVFDTPFENITGREIKCLAGFNGLIVVNNSLFKDMGGAHIEVEDTTNVRGRITLNDFVDPLAVNFVGFDETTLGFEDIGLNTNQINSGVFLDAVFSANTTSQAVGTEWVDIAVPYIVEYSQRIAWDEVTNSFEYVGNRNELVKLDISIYAESGSNNDDFEFAIFSQTGEEFTPLTQVLPYRFRQSDNTAYLSIKDRIELPPNKKFKLRVRKPSGSSTITFLSSKAII